MDGCRPRRDKDKNKNKNKKQQRPCNGKQGGVTNSTALRERLVRLWAKGARELRVDTGRLNQPARQRLLGIVLIRQVPSHKTHTSNAAVIRRSTYSTVHYLYYY